LTFDPKAKNVEILGDRGPEGAYEQQTDAKNALVDRARQKVRRPGHNATGNC